MTTKVSKKAVLSEATRIADELKQCWPAITIEIQFETREGEDAYLLIDAPSALHDEVLSRAAGFSVEAFDEKGVYILPDVRRLD